MSGKAIILGSCDFSGKKTRTVHFAQADVPLRSISINGDSVVWGGVNASLFTVQYNPSDTIHQGVIWSISQGNEYASIDQSSGIMSVLSGASNNTVTIVATSTFDSSITASKSVQVNYIKEPLLWFDGNDVTDHMTDWVNKGTSAQVESPAAAKVESAEATNLVMDVNKKCVTAPQQLVSIEYGAGLICDQSNPFYQVGTGDFTVMAVVDCPLEYAPDGQYNTDSLYLFGENRGMHGPSGDLVGRWRFGINKVSVNNSSVGNALSLWCNDGSSLNIDSGVSLTSGKHILLATRSSSMVQFYVDGVAVGTAQAFAKTLSETVEQSRETVNCSLRVLTNHLSNPTYAWVNNFIGDCFEIRFYDIALPQDFIPVLAKNMSDKYNLNIL